MKVSISGDTMTMELSKSELNKLHAAAAILRGLGEFCRNHDAAQAHTFLGKVIDHYTDGAQVLEVGEDGRVCGRHAENNAWNELNSGTAEEQSYVTE